MSLVYLASPYNGYLGSVSEAYSQVCKMASKLMLSGEKVFCPIAHSHAIEEESKMVRQEGDWWLRQDFAILKHCTELAVYQMPGWDRSYGVGKEIEFAKEHGIPIRYIRWDGLL